MAAAFWITFMLNCGSYIISKSMEYGVVAFHWYNF